MAVTNGNRTNLSLFATGTGLRCVFSLQLIAAINNYREWCAAGLSNEITKDRLPRRRS